MNLKELNILKILNKNNRLKQREISEKAEISLGTTNNIINYLLENNFIELNKIDYRNTEYIITEKGNKKIEETLIKTAVILAAGMGTRLQSITQNLIPKGFIEIEGKTLIERSIDSLLKNGVEKIIIVTGHLNEYYDKLSEKYKNVYTVKNKDYKNTGSMSSLAVASDFIEDDFILLESDIIYEEMAIKELQDTNAKDCVLLSGETQSGDEVYVEVRNDNIYKLSKDKHSLNNIYGELVGICKISSSLLNKMMLEFFKNTNPQYHYEYAIEDAAKNYIVSYKKINDLVWAEIDDENHLNRVEKIIVPKLIYKNQL
ncbi:NTP transferase domain-containing protein [Clostridium botulinum]|uniref:NTP transferase domain-containing protein n=1 Tax=Clostridium botulinum TaxID=1491 RepID=UPI001968180E|nr:NTP transferase domain-containing protein [Clostridium botulinum]MBN1076782.1 winged helix-turn-helix transcriptional regulator [Clostridium botulinum]HBJ1645939.1 NTP transferase domain-containing protein [Clostridium botulinum]